MSDLLLRGARGLDFRGGSQDGAVLVRGDRILACGPEDEIRGQASAAREINLRGCVLLPGLVDTHTHFFELARRRAGIDLAGARDLDALRRRLEEHRDRLHPEQVWVGGGGWEPGLAGAGLDRQLLDDVFGDRAIALESRDFHTLWCSSRALAEAGVLAGAEAPPGGEIGRREDGTPNGLLKETAWDLIWAVRPVEPDSVASNWLADTARYAHSLGLTGIHCMEPTSSYHHYRRLAERDELRLRVCFHTPRADLSDRIEEGAASYRAEHPWLRRGGVKIFGDGSLGSRSAWMRHPYPDGTHGWPLLSEEELLEDVLRAAQHGIAPSVHAIGDATLDMVLRCFARLRERPEGRSLLLRVEHAQCVRPDALDELARLQVYCAVQPVHLEDDIALLETEWGEAARYAYPLRSLRDAGVSIGLGSDAPVAPLDPREGIRLATDRRDRAGQPWQEQEALTVREALAGYTVHAARGGAWDGECGVIAEGALADLVAVDDVGEVNGAGWAEATTRLTVAGGDVVYEALG